MKVSDSTAWATFGIPGTDRFLVNRLWKVFRAFKAQKLLPECLNGLLDQKQSDLVRQLTVHLP